MQKIKMRLIREGVKPTKENKSTEEIDGLQNGTLAQLAVSQGNDDQISLSMPQLNWHVIIFSSSVQTLMRLRIRGKGSIMHRIERKS